jgi:hypothetical protein
MRRHEPRASPSSTRELGPIDATIRESLLAPERMTTQCRDTDRTQRPDRRDGTDAGGTPFTDFIGAAIGTFGGVAGSASLTTVVGATLSRRTLSTATIVGADAALSVIAASARAVSVSVSNGADADAGTATDGDTGGAFAFERPVSLGEVFRATHTAPTRTAATAPMPRQIRGPIGGRAGFVPHHLHAPTVSG